MSDKNFASGRSSVNGELKKPNISPMMVAEEAAVQDEKPNPYAD